MKLNRILIGMLIILSLTANIFLLYHYTGMKLDYNQDIEILMNLIDKKNREMVDLEMELTKSKRMNVEYDSVLRDRITEVVELESELKETKRELDNLKWKYRNERDL